MTKLIVDASDFLKMLPKETEVELIKNGAAQIAEQFKRRVLGDQDALIERLISEINQRLSYKYQLPETVLRVIRDVTMDNIKKFNEKQADETARKYFDEAFKAHSDALEKKIDGMATSLIEKKINAVFAQAARMK